MSVEAKILLNGKYAPAAWHSNAQGLDFNGTDYCFITEADYLNPGDRELASALSMMAWVVAPGSPVVVPSDMFGTHSHNLSLGTSVFPAGFNAGWVRSHDGYLDWFRLQPVSKAAAINWTNLDRWLAEVEAIGAKPIYVVYGSPAWASSKPTEKCAYSNAGFDGVAAPPTNMADLGDFVTQVAQRYGSRIMHYEIWNEVNVLPAGGVAAFYSGTWTELADICKTVNQAVKIVNPSAIIIGPSSVGWEQTGGPNDPTVYVPLILAATDSGSVAPLKSWIDWMSCHLYHLAFPASNMLYQYATIRAVMTAAGIGAMPLVDTESGDLAAAYSYHTDELYTKIMQRHLVLAATLNIKASCWYSWDGNAATLGFKNRSATVSLSHQLLTTMLAGSTINQLLQTKSGRLIGIATKDEVVFPIDV